MQQPTISIRADDLRQFVTDIFKAAGFSDDSAAIEAKVLVWANARGVDSHGIFRIPRYIDAIASGHINAHPTLKVIRQSGASCTIDADRAAGPVAMTFGMDSACDIASVQTIGWTLITNTTHTGPMGYYAREAVNRGMIGIVMCSSRPLMAYHGSAAAALPTNPIAIAIPRANAAPLVLDMASSAIAWGKLLQAKQAGTDLPEGVAMDAAGHMTTDPAKAVVPMPMAGPKGAGLSLMIECLVSVLASIPLVEPSLNNQNDSPRAWQNAAAIAVNIAGFTDPNEFATNVDALAIQLKQQPTASGFDEILMPGERGDRLLEERLKSTIPVLHTDWDQLVNVAKRFNITAPEI